MYFTNRNKQLAESIRRLEELNKNYDNILSAINNKEVRLREIEEQLKNEFANREQYLRNKEKALRKIYEEKSNGFPWLADAIAEYYKYIDFELANYLGKKVIRHLKQLIM